MTHLRHTGSRRTLNPFASPIVAMIMTTQRSATEEAATDQTEAATPPASGMSPSRRQVLVAAGLGAGALTLTACGSSSTPAAAPTSAAPAASAAPSGGAVPSGNTLIALSKVPVGGAAAATDANGKPIIIAQPTAGKAVAFSAICTHRGCTVAVAGAQLDCPCHGSKFNALTGAVINGPAPKPLPAVTVAVQGGNVVTG